MRRLLIFVMIGAAGLLFDGSARAGTCIWCGCDDTYYSTAGDCTAAGCGGGLGCFTNICVPVEILGDDPADLIAEGDQSWLEWQRNAFPNLECFGVLSPADKQYNCIAHTVGINDEWVWREVDFYGDRDGTVSVEDFDQFYAAHGYVPSADCSHEAGKRKVALFVNGGVPTHAAVQAADPDAAQAGWWESKEGQAKVALHRLTDLEDDADNGYGTVATCYEQLL